MAPVKSYTNWNSRATDEEEQIEPYRKYFFICEGANTETWYFKKLIDIRKSLNIHPLIDIRLLEKTEEDKMAIIGKLCDAVAGKLVCIVTYRALNGSDKTYRIMPLVVFSYQGGIYTIVETEKYAYTSKLAVERIKSLTLTDETFERKTNLDIPWIMTDPFGLVQTDQFEAVIKVRKESVENIKAKAWPEERVTFSRPDEDGSITLKIITSGEFELIRWLRYMGPEVKLISPDWLVEKLKESIGDLNRNYDV